LLRFYVVNFLLTFLSVCLSVCLSSYSLLCGVVL
jgi:hypothetical protein